MFALEPLRNYNLRTFVQNKIFDYDHSINAQRAFTIDCEALLFEFQQLRSYAFNAFATLWCGFSFNFVYVGHAYSAECVYFSNNCFHAIKKFLIYSNNVYATLGAFYLLYSMYYKQPVSHRARIRLTVTEATTMLKFIKGMIRRGVPDVPYIFTYMCLDNAFKIVLTTVYWGPENKFLWLEKTLINDLHLYTNIKIPIYNLADILFSDKFFSIDYVYDVDKRYQEILKKHGMKSSVTTHLKKDLENTYIAMQTVPVLHILDNTPSKKRKQVP